MTSSFIFGFPENTKPVEEFLKTVADMLAPKPDAEGEKDHREHGQYLQHLRRDKVRCDSSRHDITDDLPCGWLLESEGVNHAAEGTRCHALYINDSQQVFWHHPASVLVLMSNIKSRGVTRLKLSAMCCGNIPYSDSAAAINSLQNQESGACQSRPSRLL